jgi:putative phage-type endonuclease
MSKIVHIKQNTKEWEEWRSKGLGASDAPIVVGASPWTTRYELFLQKTRLAPKPLINQFQVAAMNRGHELEPKAREMYERISGYKFPATAIEHERMSYLRCSLDGFNSELNKLIEIKCPGKVDHAKAMQGIVPDKYYPQLQMQMLISEADKCDYISWDGVSDVLVIIPVAIDKGYGLYLLTEMIAFWMLVNDGSLVQSVRELLPKQSQPILDRDGFYNVS